MRPFAQTNARMIRTMRVFNVNASAFRGYFGGIGFGGLRRACGPLTAPPVSYTHTYTYIYIQNA